MATLMIVLVILMLVISIYLVLTRKSIIYFFVVNVAGEEHVYRYVGVFPNSIKSGNKFEIHGIDVEVIGLDTKIEKNIIEISVFCDALDKTKISMNKFNTDEKELEEEDDD